MKLAVSGVSESSAESGSFSAAFFMPETGSFGGLERHCETWSFWEAFMMQGNCLSL